MLDYCLLSVILRRDREELLSAFFDDHGIQATSSMLCEGTASKRLLDLMGFEKTEKTMVSVMVRHQRAKRLLPEMISQIGLDIPGTGVAFTIPVGSIAGNSSLKALVSPTDTQQKEECSDMPQTYLYDLIVAIINCGQSELVMDAARNAGARGGTILHAKGTRPADHFFGLSIADEKEVLLILTSTDQKNVIMRAIMEKAGNESPAKTVMFSLPVEAVAGLKSIMPTSETI